MNILKLYRRKARGALLDLILLGSLFVVLSSMLVGPTLSEYPWWDSSWNFRKQIAIHATGLGSDLANFPVLIDIVDNDLSNKARVDGADIVFTDASGTNKLAREIELYDSISGHLVAWVSIPLLSSTTNTELCMYYGNADASSQQNASAVWDSGFTMVQHFRDTAGARFDSTSNHNDASAFGSVSKSVGKIGSADRFSSTGGYLRIPAGFLPTTAITVEFWLKPVSTSSYSWVKHINTGPTSVSGIYGGLPALNTDAWTLTLSWDNRTKRFSTEGRPSGYDWIHLAVTWDGSYCYAYYNGVKVNEGPLTAVHPDWAGMPLVFGASYDGGEWFNGSIDEARVSNVARSSAWMKASYTNQKDPSTFYTIGMEETIAAPVPLILNERPSSESTDVYTNPDLSVHVVNPSGQNMTIVFKARVSNVWQQIAVFQNVGDGTYHVTPTDMNKLGTTYYWSACATENGATWTNRTFSFTTTTRILQQKWARTGLPFAVSGVLVSDINGDGFEEVVYAGSGGVLVLNGTDGNIIWSYNDTSIGFYTQPEMADLDKDGIPEVIVPLEMPAGLLVLRANNGSVHWRITGLGKETYSGPVVCDVDGDGYPEIFFCSTDVYFGLSGTGRLTELSHDGRVLNQVFVWRPCSGGLSIADADGNGNFALYMGDRHMYLNNTEYGDNDYGKGVQSYWAKNLTLRWAYPIILCSSQKPMLADVNDDGILEVIVGDMNGGVAVLNSTDGRAIRMYQPGSDTLPTHYQPSVYDIDGDGNLEIMMADPHHDPNDPTNDFASDDIVVWDLVRWKEDARMYIGKCYYGPQVGDVNGDGRMEIVACNYKGIMIFDNTYHVIDGVSNLNGPLNYAVLQDIDADGYSELIVSTQAGCIYTFDTPARRPNPRPRTEVQFYSEFRRGAAEYVQPQGGPVPVISFPSPEDMATKIPVSTSQLNFTLTNYQLTPMNFTAVTSPNIGSCAEVNVNNGRYAINVSNLDYDTTYTWTLSATNGTHWTNVTYTFTTETLPTMVPWWDGKWQYRKGFQIDHTKLSTDLQNFPVLFDIIDTDLPNKARSDGNDIAFADSNGTKLNHEIETYDNNTGHLITWVNVPFLSSTTDTKLYMYYGNGDASSQQNASAVWDSSFVMVQHFKDTSGVRLDSTSNHNDASAFGSVSKSVGKIGSADRFSSTGGYLRIPAGFLPTTAITVEFWLKPVSYSTSSWEKHINTGPTSISGICGGQTTLTQERWSLTLTWGNYPSLGSKKFSTGGQPSGYGWIHLAVTWDGSYCYAYYNGVKVNEGPLTAAQPDWTDMPLVFGASYDGGEWFNGSIDEARVSSVARSSAWMKASYTNQKDPSTFYTIGMEESVPANAPVILFPSPPNKAANVPPSLSELGFNLVDYQGNAMNYTVVTYPDIGSGSGVNVTNSRCAVNVSNLQKLTTYNWSISVTNGVQWTNVTYKFTTLPSNPPYYQNDPSLITGGNGQLICYNSTTYDSDGNIVTNIYNWYRNNKSITNLLLPFDTNSSTTVKDYSGYDNNGQVMRGATWTLDGKVGGAYKFQRGLIQIPGSSALDGGGGWSEITVEHWIYLAAPQGNTRTIARIPSYEIGMTWGNKVFAGIWVATGNPKISGYYRVAYDTPLNTSTWYHVVLTYKSGAYLILYVNGVAVATSNQTISGNIQPSGSFPLYIGWFDYFQGMIDEVRIYSRCLSPQQVNQRYLDTQSGSTDSSTIVATETATGDTWRCEVTPNDGYQDGTTKSSNTFTIGYNNKPSAKSITIDPVTPRTNDNLVGSYTYFDPDGDPENGTQIRWYKNDALQPALNDTLIVSATLTTKGEIWYFTVRTSDGKEYSETQTSPHALIQNSPPSISSVTIAPDPAYANDTLMANQTSPYDADGDDVTFTYQWQKYEDGNWVNIAGATNQTLGPENFVQGDQIKVICTPYDGQDYGTPQEAVITIS